MSATSTRARAVRATARASRALLLGAIVGCGPASPSGELPDQWVVRLPTHGLSGQEVGADASGGRIRFDGRCVSLDYSNGHSSNLVWPKTFHALAPPLMIFGASGRLIIREGDEVELGVSNGNQPVPGCPTRGVFLVGEVTSVDGLPWPDGAPAPAPTEKPGLRPK